MTKRPNSDEENDSLDDGIGKKRPYIQKNQVICDLFEPCFTLYIYLHFPFEIFSHLIYNAESIHEDY